MLNKLDGKLLPCPFCGGEAIISPGKEFKRDFKFMGMALRVHCIDCYAKITGYRKGMVEGYEEEKTLAIKLWNTRIG